MQLVDQVLLREPDYLTTLELIFRPGFLFIMFIVWSPILIYLLIKYVGKYIKKKKEKHKQVIKDVA